MRNESGVRGDIWCLCHATRVSMGNPLHPSKQGEGQTRFMLRTWKRNVSEDGVAVATTWVCSVKDNFTVVGSSCRSIFFSECSIANGMLNVQKVYVEYPH